MNETTAPGNLTDVAIVGMACRFEQSPDYATFRQHLMEGHECIPRPTRAELLASGVPSELLDQPNYVFAGGPLAGLADFDAEFFGMSPREAQVIDPQHRIFLECVWQALEDAGLIAAVAGQPVGIWGGASTSLYLLQNLLHAPEVMRTVGNLGATLGNKSDFLTLRVSHTLDLRGPSVNVQSGCSTGLVALHFAVQSLLAGECRIAIAGASSLTQLQPGGYLHQSGSIESADGHCRPFDRNAGGTARGSGAGVVVLKRLADALADGDPIHAVVRATASNNDGADKIGLTAPSELGQAAVIAEALALAGVSTDDIGCIEAHGTGTPLGDPIEIAAIARAFRPLTNRKGYCAIGSVKSNLGHLDAAAGIAGLIKAVLMVSHGEIYPTVHFTAPNPEIDFATSPLYVADRYRPWTAPARIAGVSSFGMGGTNVHVVVESPPAAPARPHHDGTVLLPLSARTPAALEQAARELAETLGARPELRLADVARTLQTGRRHWACRRHVVAGDLAEAIRALREGTSGRQDDPLHDSGLRWRAGETIDWSSLPGSMHGRHVHLPTYPFQRQRHWIDAEGAAGALLTPAWEQRPLPAQEGNRAVTLVRGTASILGTEPLIAEAAAAAATTLLHAPDSVLVDVDDAAAPSLPLARLAALDGGHYAWRGQRCFARKLVPLPATEGGFDADNVYVVKPGWSDLGLDAAQALAQLGARNVMLADVGAGGSYTLAAELDRCDAAAGAWTSAARAPELAAMLDALATATTVDLLRQAGFDLRPGEVLSRQTVLARVAPAAPYARMLAVQLEELAHDGHIKLEGDRIEVQPEIAELRRAADYARQIRERYGDHAAIADLVEHAGKAYPEVFAGTLPGTAVAASSAGTQRFLAAAPAIDAYSSRPHCLAALATLVRRLALASPTPLRILEVGGGTGTLTRAVLEQLEGLPVEYCFTDIGLAFVTAARGEAQRLGRPGLRAERLDMARDPLAQGFKAGEFDLVLALDAVHVTRDLGQTLVHLGTLLRPGGAVALVERMRVERWVERVWSLETGWWDFDDAWRVSSPLATPKSWHAALAATGFQDIAVRHGDGDSGWMLATRPGPALLDALERADASRHEHLARLRAQWAAGSGGRIEVIPPEAAPSAALHLLLSTMGEQRLAARHAVQAECGTRRIAWSGIRDLDAAQLQAVLGAGVAVVTGAAAMPARRPADTPPARTQTPLEAVLALWRELLDLDNIGETDDWYLLGGDSLLTTRVIALLEQRFRVSLPVSRFFDATTPRDMAEALADALAPKPAETEEQRLLREIEAMSEAELEAALGQTKDMH